LAYNEQPDHGRKSSGLEQVMSDLRFEDRGTAVLIHALTKRGRAWLERHAEYEREAEGAAVVERTAALDIAREAQTDGLSIRYDRPP
jgi:hypothetical protein